MWVFGPLRLLEIQRLKDKFWNYAFYKFCFLFGVLGLENLNELVLWISWFSILALILIFCQLAKDRFELVKISTSSPSIVRSSFSCRSPHRFVVNRSSKCSVYSFPYASYVSFSSSFVLPLVCRTVVYRSFSSCSRRFCC